LKPLKNRARDLKDEANRVAELTDELKVLFETLPATLEELDSMIHAEKAKADLNYIQNPKVIQEYDARKKEIDELQERVNNQEQERSNIDKDIESSKVKWLDPLREIISKISTTFSKSFSDIGCAGEVMLAEHEDFDKYGIEIKVKFRDTEELQALDSHHQSGGERSVSTILYLMSLQDLTHCPFRIVDEINQGMDPNNERKIFKQVVDIACRPNLPQYFLITPKLLPDLHFTPETTVIFIFNGPWLTPFDPNKFLV